MRANPPRRAGSRWPGDLLLYALVWTLTALASLATVLAVMQGDAVATWPFVFVFGAFILITVWPINAAWLLCMALFSTTHLGCLRRLDGAPRSSGTAVRGRCLRIVAVTGAMQTVLVLALSNLLRLPLSLSDLAVQHTPPVWRSIAQALLAYGVSPWLGSVAAGWAVGILWARRAARTP